jgi:dihydropteroate synthase
MGVLNVTPDSFSDGGKYFSVEQAVERGIFLESSGADMLDIGAESTRPGSLPVADEEQINRLIPVLEQLSESIRIPISIDTTSARVARACVNAGASIINDISGFRADSELPTLCAAANCGVILMHMRGTPKEMQSDTAYRDVVGDIADFLRESCAHALAAGVSSEHIVVDPGIGFGKTFEQNYELLGHLNEFQGIAQGVLIGTSRKAFTGEFCGLPADQRQFPTAATVAISILNGADIVRVHDVNEMKQVAEICDRYRQLQRNDSA